MQDNKNIVWTKEQLILQQWLAATRRERKPKTIVLLAKEFGVDEATIYRWRKLEGFADAVRLLIRDNLQNDLPEIYGALGREAKAGSFPHIKLALELSGEYVQKIAPTTPDGKEPYESATDVLNSRMDSLASRIAAGRATSGDSTDG